MHLLFDRNWSYLSKYFDRLSQGVWRTSPYTIIKQDLSQYSKWYVRRSRELITDLFRIMKPLLKGEYWILNWIIVYNYISLNGNIV